MIFRLLGLVALPVLAYYLVKAVNKRYTLTPRQQRILFFIVAALLVIGVLIIMGRLPVHFIVAPLGAIAAFALRFLPTLLRLAPFLSMFKSRMAGATGGKRSGNQSSKIRTEYLAMELKHETGDLEGTVLKGQFANQPLSSLNLEQLLALRTECHDDADSLQVLEAYLDRTHDQWREQAGDSGENYAPDSESSMTRELALEILGLEGEPDKKTITKAHRSLMQKMHPDRGGSGYLAQKVNAAKDFLIKQL
ncbi:unnamed protein product [Discosporangium mesarthrocarpum]